MNIPAKLAVVILSLMGCTSQTVGASECFERSECEPICGARINQLAAPDPRSAHVYVGAACEPIQITNVEVEWTGNACRCQSEGGGTNSFYSKSECQAIDRAGNCLYHGDEFPGCEPGDETVCQEVCAEVQRRDEHHAALALDLTFRDFTCSEYATCECKFENAGVCRLEGHASQAFACDTPIDEMLRQVLDLAP